MAFYSLFLFIYLVINFASSNQMLSDFVNCRSESKVFNSLIQYKLETCGKCYHYMPPYLFTNKLIYLHNGFFLNPETQELILSNETDKISLTFIHNQMSVKWLLCCKEAELCCVKHLNHTKPEQFNNQCKPTWDGWSCWENGGISGQLTTNSICPSYIYWLDSVPPPCRGYVSKQCLSNGSWFSKDGREWSNYGNCARDDIYIKRSWYKITTHLISVAFIIPALFIFNYYRQLSRVSRIRVHKHLLSSLLIYSILMSLLTLQMLVNNNLTSSSSVTSDVASVVNLNKSLISETEESNLSETNNLDNLQSSKTNLSTNLTTILCVSISLAVKYFRSTSYLWMFNEAFYLHRLIKKAFTTPSITPLLIIAYGLPSLTTIIYIYCRLFQIDFNFPSTSSNSLIETNHSSISFNSSTFNLSSAISSKYISNFLNPDNNDYELSINTKQQSLNEKINFKNQSSKFKNLFDLHSKSSQSLNSNKQFINHSNVSIVNKSNFIDDDSALDQLTDLIGTSYEDQCWSLPSPINWHEWIINIPNLCILIINCIFLISMLREIYIKAEYGQKQVHRIRSRTKNNNSRPIRACFLFTGWRKKLLPTLHPQTNSSPSISPTSDNIQQQNDQNSNKTELINHKQILITEDDNKSELVGHKIEQDNNNNKLVDKNEQTDLNNSNDQNLNNSRDSIKRRSSIRSFCRTKNAVKRQLSRLLSEKDANTDLTSSTNAATSTNRSSNLEQHTSGHRTSILVSLRAASILLPLYGLHYLIFVYRLETDVCWLSELYHYCSITLDGLQGMLVSILFCFATNEVQQVLKRSAQELFK